MLSRYKENYLRTQLSSIYVCSPLWTLKHPLLELTTLATEEMDLPYNHMLALLEMMQISDPGNPE